MNHQTGSVDHWHCEIKKPWGTGCMHLRKINQMLNWKYYFGRMHSGCVSSEKELYDKDEVIVLFDFACFYTFVTATKTYKKHFRLKPELVYQK